MGRPNGRGAKSGGGAKKEDAKASKGNGKGQSKSLHSDAHLVLKESRVELGDESRADVLALIARLMEGRGDAVPTGEKRPKKNGVIDQDLPAEDAEALTQGLLLQDDGEDDVHFDIPTAGDDYEDVADSRGLEGDESMVEAAPDEAARDDGEQEEEEEPESNRSKERRAKEERRALKRLQRQLVDEDRAEAKKAGDGAADADSKRDKPGKSSKPSSSKTVRVRVCEEGKTHKVSTPFVAPRGGPDALEELLRMAKNKLGIKLGKKDILWARVSGERGPPVRLMETISLLDEALLVISKGLPPEPAPAEASPANREEPSSAVSGNASASKSVDDGQDAMDAVRAAYAERERKQASSRVGMGVSCPEEAAAASAALESALATYRSDGRYAQMRAARDRLPASNVRYDLLQALDSSQVVIVSGEAGSGKTTQCPNFILEAASEMGRGGEVFIICTQPRRIAAVSVAERVAKERGERNGDIVGHAVRMDTRASSQTRLLFCTSGVLLQRLNSSPDLLGVTHVVIDEAHERSLQTDFTLVILRDLLKKRSDLKLIVMSATLQQDIFTQYFHAGAVRQGLASVPIVHIPGRTFPITQRYWPEVRAAATGKEVQDRASSPAAGGPALSVDAELEAWLQRMNPGSQTKQALVSPEVHEKTDYRLIADLCAAIVRGHLGPEGTKAADSGAVLIFLPGQAEIDQCLGALRLHPGIGERALLLPLHGSMPIQQQQRVFSRPIDGQRKFIAATNIAETSITIDDVTHVIDTGHVREVRYDPRANMGVFSTVWVSQAAAKQRAGRAGRMRPGVCWRLYKESFVGTLPEHTLCEMRRTALEELILQLRLLGLGEDPGAFLRLAPEPPTSEAVQCAVHSLLTIGALSRSPGLPMTPLGFHLAHMPVDVRSGKMLVYGALCRCLAPILTIAACLSSKSPFVRGFQRETEEAQRKEREHRFGRENSDHLAMVDVYNAYQAAKRKDSWRAEVRRLCDEVGLSSSTLDGIEKLRVRFLEHLVDAGFADGAGRDGGDLVNEHKDNRLMVRCVLCAGLFPNVAQVQRENSANGRGTKTTLVSRELERCVAHPSSINSRRVQEFPARHGWLLYHTKIQTSQIFLTDSTLVGGIPLLLFGGELKVSRKKEAKRYYIQVDGQLLFDCKEEAVAVIFKMLRKELDRLLLLKVANPSADLSTKAVPLLASITKLLHLESLRL